MIAEKSSHVKVKRVSGLAESKAVFQTPAILNPAGGCKELFVHFHSMTQPCFNLALQTMCATSTHESHIYPGTGLAWSTRGLHVIFEIDICPELWTSQL